MSLLEKFGRIGQPLRWPAFNRALSLVKKPEVDVVEIGVSAKYQNGLSTAFWAESPRVKSIIAIDINGDEMGDFMGVVGDIPKIKFVLGHSLLVLASLPDNSIDLLYLDGDVDPLLTFHEYLAACPKLRPGAIVIADDFDTKAHYLHTAVTGRRIPFGYKGYGGWNLKPSSFVEGPRPDGTIGMLIFRHDGPPMIKLTK